MGRACVTGDWHDIRKTNQKRIGSFDSSSIPVANTPPRGMSITNWTLLDGWGSYFDVVEPDKKIPMSPRCRFPYVTPLPWHLAVL
eukprot:gene26451-biopygen16501